MNSSKKSTSAVIALLFLTILTSITACGSGSSGSSSATELEKIADFDRILSIADVEKIGWKLGKTYDVEGLEGADAAYVGFWNLPDIGSLNYEIRVYPSHTAAVEH